MKTAKMNSGQQRIVVVLGMHRSGTSAVTRGLQVMGVELGNRLMPPVADNNPKGFWEDIDLNALNIDILNALRNDWRNLAPVSSADINLLRKEGLFLRAVELLRAKVGDAAVFGFKDPRMAKLLPFWKEVFRYCRFKVGYVMAVRHPLSVVKSLAKRDDIDAITGYLLWLGHVISTLSGTAETNRVFVDYDRLLASPEHELARVAGRLELVIDPPALQAYKAEFLDQGLRHTFYDFADLELDDQCPALVREVYATILDMALDKVRFDDPALGKTIEHYVAELERLSPLLTLADRLLAQNMASGQALAERDDQVAGLNQALTARDRQIAELSQAVVDRGHQVAELSQAVIDHGHQVTGLRRAVVARDDQIADLNQAMAERDRQIAELSQAMADRDHQVVGLSQAVTDYGNQVTELSQALTDRDHQVVGLSQAVTDYGRQVAALNQALAERDGRIVGLNQALAERDGQIANLNYQIAELLNSTSWRITAGLRWIKRLKAQSLPPGEMIRALFRKVPLSIGTKTVIKSAAFRYAGWLFRDWPSYRLWNEMRHPEQASSGDRSTEAPLPPVNSRKILVIDATTPTPDRDAGSLTAWFYLKAFLELKYEITFIPDNLQPLRHYTDNLRALGVRCLTNEDIGSVDEFLVKEGAELELVLLYRVHVARLHAPSVKKYAPQAKIIFDTVDLHYLREERQAELSQKREEIERAQYTKHAELEMMRDADATIVLSQVEREIISKEDPSINVFTIPLLLDVVGCRASFAERKDIVFIGGFLHQPNVDAVKYFVSEIWPDVRQLLPDVRLLVIGSEPPADIRALGKADERIKVIGYVEDLDSYFDRCRLSVVPLRYGAGIKGKIGTSASYGVPCVATTVAVEGMGLRDGLEVVVADEAEHFATKLVELYGNEELWNRISQGALDFVQRNYSYEMGKARLKRLLNALKTGLHANEILDFSEIRSREEFRQYQSRSHDEYARRLALERGFVVTDRGAALEGYCAVCRSSSSFQVDLAYAFTDAAGQKRPNWRERLVCAGCELNNRMRAAIHLFRQECAPAPNADIYLTEQTTALYSWVKHYYQAAVGSEYLGPDRSPGEINFGGIRHESLTGLSFADRSFDFILSFDVLEHIPDYRAAIRECSRILRPGGQMLFSVPFCFEADQHIVRARVREDGGIEHLMDQEYHGDPVNAAGCLCFYHFGWQLLAEFREAGFASVKALFYWSDKFAYLGLEQALFIATKHVENG